MQASAAKLAKNAAKIEALVAFLTQRCLLDEPSARAIATRNARKWVLKELAYGHSFLAYSSDDDVPDAVKAFLQLEDLFEGEKLEHITSRLAAFFLCERAATAAAMSAGKKSRAVQYFRSKMLECAREYCSNRETLALDDFVLMCQVTFCRLIDAKGTPAGVMAVFPDGLRQRILGAIPKAPALLERVLAEAARAAVQIAAPSRRRVRVPEVLEEPDELLCDEHIADLDRKCCSTDSTHDTTVSAEQASAEEASGYTTPSPTKISNLSKLELFRLQCAPLKMPRQHQD